LLAIRRRFPVLLLLLVSIAVSGCRTTPPTAPSTTTEGLFKVAMLLPGPIDDQSWSQAGYEALRSIERDLAATVAYEASVPETAFEERLRAFAGEGYDLVIGHGSQFYPAAEVVAQAFPRVKFAVVGSFAGNNTNLGAVSFRDSEVSYLVGVVAAVKTRTNKVAYIGGFTNGSQEDAVRGVQQGLKATNPEVSLAVSWVDSWTDQERARQIAQEHLAAGVDVLIQNADTAGQAVLTEAERAGVYAIGWSQDQHILAPKAVLTSPVQRVSVLLLKTARLVRQGRWEGKQYKLGLQDGAIDLAPFYGLLSPQEERAVQTARDAIMTGAITIEP